MLAGTPVIEGHGDLHVGQVLHSAGRFVVTDFDGNPILRAEERMLPIPPALDVAGMAQSLAHSAIVARKHTHLDAAAVAEVDTLVRGAFLALVRGPNPDSRVTPTCTTRLPCTPSGRNRCCARSSMRQGICPDGCMFPTQHFPLSSTKGGPT